MQAEQDNKQPTWIERVFVDRQIYLRSQGEVSFVSISARTQVVITGIAGAAFLWVAFASANVMFRDEIIEAKNQEIDALTATTEEQVKDIETLQGAVLEKTQDLEERSDYLQGLIESDPTGTLAIETEPALDTIPDTPEAAEDENAPASNTPETGLMSMLVSNANAAPGAILSQEFETYITARLDALSERQDALAAHLTVYAENRIMEADDMLAPFRMKAHDLAKATTLDLSTLGQGGPNLADPATGEGLLQTPSFDPMAPSPYPVLHESWSRLVQVYNGLQSVPLLFPVKDFYLSSRFGRRTDPFTKQPGWHPGVDLAGWPGTPIETTNTGIVTKAGTWSTYGKMVEVDHGNGFKTRYAHLRKVKVKRGQMVKAGDIIGEMGCTGRCVSTHLHYEVFFNNNLRNPLPFMEAPEDVQQTKRKTATATGKGN